MKGSWAAALAAGANFLGSRLQSDYEFEQKQKLYKMQQDVEMQRQMFLEKYKADLYKEKKDDDRSRVEGDIVGQFQDPETKNWYGRTRTGSVVPLNETSPEFQQTLKDKGTLTNDNIGARTNLANARLGLVDAQKEHLGKMDANIDDQINHRNKPKEPKDNTQKIRDDYLQLTRQFETDENGRRKEAEKAGKQFTPSDPAQAQQGIMAKLYSVYGGPTVRSALGADTPKQQAPQAAAPQAQPTAGKPTPEQIIAEANAAVKARPDLQPQIEAKMKAIFQQYGYSQ